MQQEIVETRFDYNQIDTEVRISLKQRADRINERTRRVMADIWENGREFHEAQQELANYGNGRFQAWIEAETGYSKRAVYNFISVYNTFDRATVAQTGIPAKVLYLLSAPSTTEEARQAVIEAADQGERITYNTAKKTVERLREPQKLLQHDLVTILRGWIEQYGGERENWQPLAMELLGDKNEEAMSKIKDHLSQYEYTAPMFILALSEIIDQEKEFKHRQAADQQIEQHRDSVADPRGRRPPKHCPRCHAARASELVAENHWRCRNCAREYDDNAKWPETAVAPAAAEPRALAVWEVQPAIKGWLHKTRPDDSDGTKIKVLEMIKDGRSPGGLANVKEHVLTAYEQTSPPVLVTGNVIKQAIGNLVGAMRQRMEQEKAAKAAISEYDAAWQLRLYLNEVYQQLDLVEDVHGQHEVVALAATAVKSSINLAIAELKRATSGESEEEE